MLRKGRGRLRVWASGWRSGKASEDLSKLVTSRWAGQGQRARRACVQRSCHVEGPGCQERTRTGRVCQLRALAELPEDGYWSKLTGCRPRAGMVQ